jgi:hypothetical protein
VHETNPLPRGLVHETSPPPIVMDLLGVGGSPSQGGLVEAHETKRETRERPPTCAKVGLFATHTTHLSPSAGLFCARQGHQRTVGSAVSKLLRSERCTPHRTHGPLPSGKYTSP